MLPLRRRSVADFGGTTGSTRIATKGDTIAATDQSIFRSASASATSGAIFWTLVGTVILLPLPLAGVYTWTWGLMSVIVGVLVGVWGVRVALGYDQANVGLYAIWPMAALFALSALWMVVQWLPFTPREWHHPLWTSAADVLGAQAVSRISINPEATLAGLTRFLAYGGIFWLSLQYCRRKVRARQVMLVMTYSGLAYAVYGLIVQFSGMQSVLWFQKYAYLNDVTSTFVNRNSYATFAGLCLVCATGLVMVMISQAVGTPLTTREKVRRLLEGLPARGWSLLVAWMVGMSALLLSHSRAGFLSTVLALVVLIVGLRLAQSIPKTSVAAFGFACGLALVAFFALSGAKLEERLASTSLVQEERPIVYELTLDAIANSPILGTGYGTFEDVFRFYRSSDLRLVYQMAHSTYLENMLELGVPIALAIFGVFVGFLIVTYRGLRRRRQDAVYPCIGFAATVLVAAHSIVDFSLQIPAVSAAYFLIMGAACAQSWSSRRPTDPW